MKAVRVLGYVGWFLGCFVVGLVLTFPLDGFKPLLVSTVEQQLGKGKQGPHGVDPVFAVDSVGVSGLGVKAKRVHVQLGSREPEPGPAFDIDEAWISFRSLLSFSRPEKRIDATAKLYGGSVAVLAKLDEKQNPTEVHADIDGVDLGKAPALMMALGVPVEGKIDADLELDMGKQPDKDASGHLNIDAKGLSIGPGKIQKAMGFELAEAVKLGDIKGRIPVKQGIGTIEALKIENAGAIEAEIEGNVTIKPRLQSSRIDASGWFRPVPAFLAATPSIKTIFDLADQNLPGAPPLGRAKDDEGRYQFSLRGAVGSLTGNSFQFAKDGKRPKTRTPPAAKAPATPATPAPAEDADDDAKPE